VAMKIERHNLGFLVTTPGDDMRHRAHCRDIPEVLAVVAHYHAHPHDKTICEFCRQVAKKEAGTTRRRRKKKED
jgi:hypothetical protein